MTEAFSGQVKEIDAASLACVRLTCIKESNHLQRLTDIDHIAQCLRIFTSVCEEDSMTEALSGINFLCIRIERISGDTVRDREKKN